MTICSYDAAADLSVTGEQVIGSIRPSRPISASVSSSPLTTSPGFDWRHELIFRFRYRTVLSMGSPRTAAQYAEVVPRLAIQHEYLLHSIVAITLLHDRAISGSRSTSTESYHLSHAAAKFNQKLSSTITNEDKDALWATAVYMCTASVFNIDTTDPGEAWPLKTSQNDLKWLNLQAGLRVIWSISELQRQDGAFAYVGECVDDNCVFPRLPEPGIVGLPPLLVELCDLDEWSNASNSPYHAAVRCLSWLLPIECTFTNVLSFMTFAGSMTKWYRDHLQQKDPRALLLLGIWYSRMFNSSWWMIPRATVEAQAIYRYLCILNIEEPVFQKVLSLLGDACELQLQRARCSPVQDSNLRGITPNTSMAELTWIT